MTGGRISAGAGRTTWHELRTNATRLTDGSTSRVVDGGPSAPHSDGLHIALSGDRMLHETWEDGVYPQVWRLRDLRTDAVTALPPAVDYDLWGERLVRLEDDGRVTLLDLRTGAAPVQCVPPRRRPRRESRAACTSQAISSPGS